PAPTLFPYTTLFRSRDAAEVVVDVEVRVVDPLRRRHPCRRRHHVLAQPGDQLDGATHAPAQAVEVGRPVEQGDVEERGAERGIRSEEHTSELQSLAY